MVHRRSKVEVCLEGLQKYRIKKYRMKKCRVKKIPDKEMQDEEIPDKEMQDEAIPDQEIYCNMQYEITYTSGEKKSRNCEFYRAGRGR